GVVTSLTRFAVAVLQVSAVVDGVPIGVAGQLMVALPPAGLIIGGVVSTTVMVWLTWLEWLPQASVASQVLVRVYVPVQAPGVVTSLTRLTVPVLQVSVAGGGVIEGVAG